MQALPICRLSGDPSGTADCSLIIYQYRCGKPSPPAHIEAPPQVLHAAQVGLLLGRGGRVGQQASHLAVLDKHAQHGAKGGCRHEGVIARLVGVAAANLLQGQDLRCSI